MSNGRIVDRRRRCSRALSCKHCRGVRRMDLDFAAELVCKFLSGLRDGKNMHSLCIDSNNFRGPVIYTRQIVQIPLSEK